MKLAEIGNKIKTLRKDNHLTQQQLADKVGIGRVTLGRVERGETVSVSIAVFDLIIAQFNYEIDFKKIDDFGLPNLSEN